MSISSDRYWHWQSGLRVSSPWAIPEWPECDPAADKAPDVEIAIISGVPPGTWLVDCSDRYRFQVAGVGTFVVDRGRRIQVAVEPEAVAQDVRAFLIGTAWAAIAAQRGMLVLHASAVVLGTGAVVFCGPSGAGKSTLAAALLRRGAPLISDDLCRCEVRTNGRAAVYPGATRMKLWRASVEDLRMAGAVVHPDAYRPDKLHLRVPAVPGVEPIPLRAICLLAWGGSFSITAVTGRAAARALVEVGTFRSHVIVHHGAAVQQWAHCVALVQQVPIWRVTRPQGEVDVDTVADRLCDELYSAP